MNQILTGIKSGEMNDLQVLPEQLKRIQELLIQIAEELENLKDSNQPIIVKGEDL